MKIPLNFWLYSTIVTVGVSSWYSGLRSIQRDPAAAWWFILEIGSMVIYKLIKDRWYSSADETPTDSSSTLTIYEDKDLQISLKIVWTGFILSAAMWVFVAMKDESILPFMAAISCLVIALLGKWWLVRFATWSNSNLKETAWVNVGFSLLVAFAVAFP